MTHKLLIEQVKNATHLGTFDAQSPEWHELRSRGIGGSLVGTIAGLNKWESAYTAFHKFTGKIPAEIPDNAAMEWGRRLESTVLGKFKDEHPDLTVLDEVGTWQNIARPYQIANPDAIAIEPDGSLSIIEIKTARYPDDWEETVPLYYQTQVQWYLSTFGFAKAYVAVLISGSDYREFEILANPFQQDTDIQLVERFLAAVEKDEPPKWDGSKSTYETVRTMHPLIQETEVELGAVGQDLQIALDLEKTAIAKAQALKSQVLGMMGTAKRGLVDGQHAFSRQARGTGLPFLITKK